MKATGINLPSPSRRRALRLSGRNLRHWAEQWLQTSGVDELRADGPGPDGVIHLRRTSPDAARRPHRLSVGLYRPDPDGRLRTLGRLAEFKFNGREPALRKGIFSQAHSLVFQITLENDLPVTSFIAAESLPHLFQLLKAHNFSIFVKLQIRVLTRRSFANDAADTGHGGSSKIVLPV